MEPKPVLLYVFPRRSIFIQRDLDLLAPHFEVRAHELLRGPQVLLPWRLLMQLFWLIGQGAWKHDAICHFSGYVAVLPALLTRRCFVILAGADCAGIPWIQYGNHVREPLGWATRFAARRAHRLLPVHELLIEREQHYDDQAPSRQGIRAFAPDLRVPFTAIPYGFDPEQWKHEPTAGRSPLSFITVVGTASPGVRVRLLKGVDLILGAAERLPSAHFRVIGMKEPIGVSGTHRNVEFVPRATPGELRSAFSSATYYVQLSLSEGFPNGLCEAMLCGCIPIVSDVSSMPGTVEGIGLVVKHRSVDEATAAFTAAMDLDLGERERRSIAARVRIAERFTLEHRKRALLAALRSA